MLDALLPSDAPAAAALSSVFGWPHRSEDWALFLSLAEGVAWREGGALLGTAAVFPFGPDHGSIGLVQVAPALQGRGIGRRLMEAVIERGAGRSLMLHATPEGAPLYAKLGFEPRGLVQQWQGVAAGPAGAPHRATATDLPSICALDEAATGLRRAGLLQALVRVGAVTLSGPAAAPSGYAIRRRFGRGQVIGPVVAQDEAAAIASTAALREPGFLRLDIPARASALAASLTEAGLAQVDTVQVMVRGAWPDAPSVFGLSSQAMG